MNLRAIAPSLLRHPGSMRGMFMAHNGITLAETYIRDLWDWEGDREAMFELIEAIGAEPYSTARKLQSGRATAALAQAAPQAATALARARAFAGKTALHRAQSRRRGLSLQRRHRILRRVSRRHYELFQRRLRGRRHAARSANSQIRRHLPIAASCSRGQHVLDVGCGWGGFILHAAQPLRRRSDRHHPVAAAVRRGQPAHQSGGPGKDLSRRRVRLPRDHAVGASSTPSLRSRCSSTSGARCCKPTSSARADCSSRAACF